MNSTTWLKFFCPNCHLGILKKNGHVSVGCQHCGTIFPIIDGIPRLVEMNNYGESFGYQWNIHQKTQLDSYTGLPISKKRLYAATGWNEETDLSGQSILEAGSGAGRFTESLVKTNASIYSFDYSSAVVANKRNNGEAENLTLFQGDIFSIPFEDNTFDHVFCLGVLQHTPDPKAAFQNLVSKVKEGGFLYIDVYTQSWYHYLHWKYILRPLTRRMNRERLYRLLSYVVPKLIPVARFLRQWFGRTGSRLVPIVEFSHLDLSKEINEQWAILDTFDMYSPAHDHPQTKVSVNRWFKSAGFKEISVWYGDNGVVGHGKKNKVDR